MQKKGQLSLGDAPSVIMIVGLVFLLMATIAYISYQYQSGFGAPLSNTVTNETTSSTVTAAGVRLSGAGNCNFQSLSIGSVTNSTGAEIITAGNYTTTSNGIKSITNGLYNGTIWNVTYTYSYAGSYCNVTNSLNTQIDNNTSIAGIVLTISLVGIVLTVLIGVFILVGRRRV